MKKLILLLLLIPIVSFGQTDTEYFDSGNDKAEAKDYYGAISDYTKAIEINPNNNEAYMNRGLSKADLNDLTGACADWKKAASLGYTNSAEWVANQCN